MQLQRYVWKRPQVYVNAFDRSDDIFDAGVEVYYVNIYICSVLKLDNLHQTFAIYLAMSLKLLHLLWSG